MVDSPRSERPAELVAASDHAVELTGRSTSVEMVVPSSTTSRLAEAASPRQEEQRLYLNVEDLEAERNPTVIYGVFLFSGDRDISANLEAYHVGNVAPFGIEHAREPDVEHHGDPSFRHTFDVTDHVHRLAEAGEWDPGDLRVTFEIIPPLPPPGAEADDPDPAALERDEAGATPLRIGRVSLFVG